VVDMEHSKDDSSVSAQKTDRLSSNRSLPERYKISEHEGKRILACLEVPNIKVQIESGLTVSSSAARKSPAFTIYLDGVAQSEPFLDLEKQIYNFDHHEGCLRSFTLSTCEQVLVMILKGLDLRGHDWRVLANEPDLDTILAIWLIFNHVRIQQKEFEGLDRLCALVRLEGIIDAHGLEMSALSGFTPKFLAQTEKLIRYLRVEEIDLKSRGIWRESDFLEYTALILHKVDRIIYKSSELGDVKDVKELARVECGENRFAVVIETQLGIYELEPYLDRLYGDKLGLVILKKESSTYTLRRMDPFMARDLNAVYRILNFIDPAVRDRAEAHKWGGSAEIGGSPRGEGGTQLTPQEIANACRDAFAKAGLGVYMVRLLYGLVLLSCIAGISTVCVAYPPLTSWLNPATRHFFMQTDLLFFGWVAFWTALCLGVCAHKRPWQFGWAVPVGKSWLIFSPLIVGTVVAIGIYFPYQGIPLAQTLEAAFYFLTAIPLAWELLFRSLIPGVLITPRNFQNYAGRRFISFPSAVAALLYSICMTAVLLVPTFHSPDFQALALAECLVGSLVLGLLSGLVRERTQSVLPGILLHALGMALLISYHSGGWVYQLGGLINGAF
jgi:hypothetical protein